MDWINGTALVPLPVIVPLFAAGLALAMYRLHRVQRVISVAALSIVTIVSAVLLVLVESGPIVVDVGGWAAPIGIVLVADRLSTVMVTVSSLVTLCVLIYSIAQGQTDGDEGAPVAIYHPTYLVLTAGVSNAFLTGDLFNLYVGFEILLFASYVLLTMQGTKPRIRAGTVYVVVSLLSSVIFLVALSMVYAATGTINMAQLALRLGEIDPNVSLVLQLLLLTAFGIKAAIFPLSAWLPDSYPTAPAPVTAVFAGLLTKVGVYAVIRTQTLLFPDGRLNTLLMWAALATMLIGILGAIAQEDIKRLLSFTLVSHIGFMIFGIAVASELSIAASIFYVIHHITVQTGLFLVVGMVERQSGTTNLRELGGLAKTAPLLGILFFIPAMNLAGIPPMSGFIGKVGLLEAGVAENTTLGYVLVAGALVTSLLTLYAVVRAWNRGFWNEPKPTARRVRQPAGLVGPTMVLVAVGVALAVVGGPVFDYARRASEGIIDRDRYIHAVLPDGQRGSGVSPDVTEEEGAKDDTQHGGSDGTTEVTE